MFLITRQPPTYHLFPYTTLFRSLKDVMTTQVEVIAPGTSVQEAARKMRDLDVGALPVSDGKRIAGVVTDRDIAIQIGRAQRLNSSHPSISYAVFCLKKKKQQYIV